jgi:hypothetical protein
MRMEEALEEDADATMNPYLEAYQPDQEEEPPLLYMRRSLFKPPTIRKPEGRKEGEEEEEEDEENTDDAEYQPPPKTVRKALKALSPRAPSHRKDLRPPDILNQWGRGTQMNTPGKIFLYIQVSL